MGPLDNPWAWGCEAREGLWRAADKPELHPDDTLPDTASNMSVRPGVALVSVHNSAPTPEF